MVDLRELLAKIPIMATEISYEKIDSLLLFFQESVSSLNIPNKFHSKNNGSDVLMCTKCMELLYEPITVPCGHTFCKSCAEKDSKCDSCYANISLNKVKPNIVLTNICQKWFPDEYRSRELATEGNLFQSNKEYKSAIESYTKALELVPWSHNCFLNRGITYFELNLFQKALCDIEMAITFYKNLPKAFLIKAAVHEKLKQYPEALISYYECIALGYEKSDINENLKKVFLKIFNIFPNNNKVDDESQKSVSQTEQKCLKRKIDDKSDDETSDTKKVKLSEVDTTNTTTPDSDSLSSQLDDEDIAKDNIEMLANHFPTIVSNENPTWAICDQDILAAAGVAAHALTEPTENTSPANIVDDDDMPEMESIPISAEIQSIDAYEELKQKILNKISVTFNMTDEKHLSVQHGYALDDINTKLVEVGDFECSLCMRLYYKPICTICGHVFCLECLQRSLDHSPQCPLCKQFIALNSADHSSSLVVEEIANKLIHSLLPDAHQERVELEEVEISVHRENFPVFVCTAAFPSIACPLHIFEPKYRLMLRRAIKFHDNQFGMCLQSTTKQFHEIGTILSIRDVKYFPDGRAVVDSIGIKRFRSLTQSKLDGYNTCTYTIIADQPIQSQKEVEATEKLFHVVFMRAKEWYENLKSNIQQQIIHHYGKFPEKQGSVHGANGPDWHWWVLAVLPVENKVKVTVLRKGSLRERLLIIHRVLTCLKQRSQTETPPRQ